MTIGGSQRAPFFSPETCAEMIVPAMKRFTDHAHAKGLFTDLHSCGHIEKQVPNIIAAGWDSWGGMPMNDRAMLYEKVWRSDRFRGYSGAIRSCKNE